VTVITQRPPSRLAGATDEGLRLFFPLVAVYAALWPLLWVLAWGFGLPLAAATAPMHWHAQEMLVGAYGASLLGFLTSALPEWTDSRRLSGRPLLVLAAAWGLARLVGLVGAEPLILLAGLADQLWLWFLAAYVGWLSWRRRSTAFLGFLAFLATLAVAAGLLRFAMAFGAFDVAERAVRLIAFAFLGLLGLALARITVPISNVVLDPSEKTSPFRPHPGRVHLAPGLIGLVLVGEIAGLSEPTRGFLLIAAGAAFLDRVGEGFIGRAGLQLELLCLTLTSAVTGTGLILAGLAAIGLGLSATAALHVMLMGGLGLGVLSVLSISGLRHMSRALVFAPTTKAAFALMLAATALRVAPDFLPQLPLPGGPHALASLLWLAAFVAWGWRYVPLLWSRERSGSEHC
jgi:uncharacterized protein involved in response to NO